MHPWLNDVHQYSLMPCIRHCYGTTWLNAVLALIYGSMICIRHHNVAQTCALYISKARCGACIDDSSCASCINIPQYNMTHHTKLTTSYFVHFLFCYLCIKNYGSAVHHSSMLCMVHSSMLCTMAQCHGCTAPSHNYWCMMHSHIDACMMHIIEL